MTGNHYLEPASVTLTQAEYERYSRHLILPGVGLEGQKKQIGRAHV